MQQFSMGLFMHFPSQHESVVQGLLSSHFLIVLMHVPSAVLQESSVHEFLSSQSTGRTTHLPRNIKYRFTTYKKKEKRNIRKNVIQLYDGALTPTLFTNLSSAKIFIVIGTNFWFENTSVCRRIASVVSACNFVTTFIVLLTAAYSNITPLSSEIISFISQKEKEKEMLEKYI
jgi:hypothetical protein